ncbi:MAG: hypothetical protein ABI759_28695 [Candidatus Solibacter sp.]
MAPFFAATDTYAQTEAIDGLTWVNSDNLERLAYGWRDLLA